MSDLADAAAAYAYDGWAVFPCKPRGKTPATEHGVLDATSDLAAVETWWRDQPNANIGLATGQASGIVAVDLDGPEGLATWQMLIAEHHAHETLVSRTGSGGYHIIYAIPPGAAIRNTARRLGPGVDTRGDGGYIIAPPSVHPTGGLYTWHRHRTPAPCPTWILDRLIRRDTPIAIPTPRFDFGDDVGTRYGRAALDRILDELALAQVGGRNDALNAAAYAVGRLVAGGELHHRPAIEALETGAANLGLTKTETEATIRSGFHAGFPHPARKTTR